MIKSQTCLSEIIQLFRSIHWPTHSVVCHQIEIRLLSAIKNASHVQMGKLIGISLIWLWPYIFDRTLASHPSHSHSYNILCSCTKQLFRRMELKFVNPEKTEPIRHAQTNKKPMGRHPTHEGNTNKYQKKRWCRQYNNSNTIFQLS